jgi:hypothetical protein
MVCSLLSISRDGHRLKVDYGISVVELTCNVLLLLEEDLSLHTILVLSQALRPNSDLSRQDARLAFIEFLRIEALSAAIDRRTTREISIGSVSTSDTRLFEADYPNY